jgi:hypothetical protein
VAGCEGRKNGRGFRVGAGVGWEVLDELWDANGASWLDVDDDVSSSLMDPGRAILMCRALWTSWSSVLANRGMDPSRSSGMTSIRMLSS